MICIESVFGSSRQSWCLSISYACNVNSTFLLYPFLTSTAQPLSCLCPSLLLCPPSHAHAFPVLPSLVPKSTATNRRYSLRAGSVAGRTVGGCQGKRQVIFHSLRPRLHVLSFPHSILSLSNTNNSRTPLLSFNFNYFFLIARTSRLA